MSKNFKMTPKNIMKLWMKMTKKKVLMKMDLIKK